MTLFEKQYKHELSLSELNLYGVWSGLKELSGKILAPPKRPKMRMMIASIRKAIAK